MGYSLLLRRRRRLLFSWIMCPFFYFLSSFLVSTEIKDETGKYSWPREMIVDILYCYDNSLPKYNIVKITILDRSSSLRFLFKVLSYPLGGVVLPTHEGLDFRSGYFLPQCAVVILAESHNRRRLGSFFEARITAFGLPCNGRSFLLS